MNLLHVVPRIDQEAAGPSYSVPRLCQSLAELNNDVEITCLAAKSGIPGVSLDIHHQVSILKRFEISFSLIFSLYRKSYKVDVVHNHSLWSMINVASGWVVPNKKAKLVCSPRGTLSAWALSHSKLKKRIVWPLQRRALEKSDLLHATSNDEYHELRTAGFKSPIAIIPNGIDIPNISSKKETSESQMTLLFLSRIHPKKGIDKLLHAWSHLQGRHPQWKLIIAGRGESAHVKDVHELAKNLMLERVYFPGPVYGNEKSQLYWKSDIFILPTHSENFGMVVAEALAHGCPAVVTKGAPWAGLEEVGCGWWINNSIESLVSTLDQAMHLDQKNLKHMGQLGRLWMERDYSWSSIGKKMDSSYRWLISGGKKPEWIKLN